MVQPTARTTEPVRGLTAFKVWRFPTVMWVLPGRNQYHFISWSYGHLALVLVQHSDGGDGPLMACDAVTHACDRLAPRGAVLLPAS